MLAHAGAQTFFCLSVCPSRDLEETKDPWMVKKNAHCLKSRIGWIYQRYEISTQKLVSQ